MAHAEAGSSGSIDAQIKKENAKRIKEMNQRMRREGISSSPKRKGRGGVGGWAEQ